MKFFKLKNSLGFYRLTYLVLPVVYLFIKKIIRYRRNIKMKAFRKSKAKKIHDTDLILLDVALMTYSPSWGRTNMLVK